jgi:hypothetical protein
MTLDQAVDLSRDLDLLKLFAGLGSVLLFFNLMPIAGFISGRNR